MEGGPGEISQRQLRTATEGTYDMDATQGQDMIIGVYHNLKSLPFNLKVSRNITLGEMKAQIAQVQVDVFETNKNSVSG